MQALRQPETIQETDDVTVLANRPGTWILAFTPLDSAEPPIRIKVFTPGAPKPDPLDQSSAALAPFEPTHTPAKPPAPEDNPETTPPLAPAPEHGMNTTPPVSPAPKRSSSTTPPSPPAPEHVSDAASPRVYTPKKRRRHIWDGNAAYSDGGFAQDPRNGGPGGRAYSSYSEGSEGLPPSDAPGSPGAPADASSGPPLLALFASMASSRAGMPTMDPQQNSFHTHDAGSASRQAMIFSFSTPPHLLRLLVGLRLLHGRMGFQLALHRTLQLPGRLASDRASHRPPKQRRLRDRALESMMPVGRHRTSDFDRGA
ncbi:hypothetical protein BV25DRAFT_1843722 [Artomyces pyxidatus]|uniref:Uncharacterized protein n=1 Tax=Artomyces pyxidatus TaxID=48021 RepID=A0ACB8SEQ0_9AGAM|nr:hypothetical protein BV25DRAFT_1843722 [Artomyces pyxidatus]